MHCGADTRITGSLTGEVNLGTSPEPAQETVAIDMAAISTREEPPRESGAGSILEAGAVVAGRYRIRRVLGEGGMGAVYQAEDQELNRLVALKVIRPELAQREEILSRFKREVILTQEVSHRNVVRLYDLAVSDGLKFITMEFIDGEDLHSWRRRKEWSAGEIISLLIQVCRGLEAAHAVGVVHRDLKPQNIMLDRSGRVAVMDFGIAHSLEDGGMTRTGVIMGTPHYMSPEQAMGQKIDQRSDLYSLGIIIYELVTGELPFHSDTILGTLLARTQQVARPLIELRPEIPMGLSQVVSRCLERDLTLRYQNAGEMIGDLQSLAKDFAISLAPGTMEAGARATSAIDLAARTIAPGGTLTTTPLPTVPPPAPTPGPAANSPAVPKTSRRWMIPALAAGGAGAAGLAYYLWPSGDRAARSDGRVLKVLVADFANNTAEPVFERTLEPMLVIALEAAPFVTSVNRNQARKLAQQVKVNAPMDEELGRLVAVREGWDVVIGGSIDRKGSGYVVTLTATEARDGRRVGHYDAQVANKESLLGAVEKLAKPLRRDLGAADSEAVSQAVGETFTTSTVEAVKAYSQAQEQAFSGNYQQASALYRKTIQMDPDFGRAYAGLGVVYFNLGDQGESERYFQAAFQRLNRMTDREKLRTQGGYYLAKGDQDQAIAIYQELTQKYPADSAAHANLSVAYQRSRNAEGALRQGKKAIEIYPNNVSQINNVASFAICAGKFEEARQYAERSRKLNPNYVKAHLTTALAELLLGDRAKCEAAYRELQKIVAPGPWLAALGLADLAMVEGRFGEAVSELEQILKVEKGLNGQMVAVTKILMGSAQVAGGQAAAAVGTLGEAASALNDPERLAMVGHLLARANSPSKALAVAAQLEKGNRKQAEAYARFVRAEAALASRDFKQAGTHFRESLRLLDTWMVHYGMGRWYLENQQAIEALAEFIKCENRRGEAAWLVIEDVPTYGLYPGALFDSARAREASGDRVGAKQTYEEYLKYRSQASDPMTVLARERAKSLS